METECKRITPLPSLLYLLYIILTIIFLTEKSQLSATVLQLSFQESFKH